MATIEGRNASDWIKSAKERQSRGEFDETGANEARQAVNGREIPRTEGGVRGIYAFRPTKDRPAPKPATKPATNPAPNPTPAPRPAPRPAEQIAKAPEPVRKEAAMPKSETHSSPMAQTQTAKPVRDTMRSEDVFGIGSESEWNAARDEAKKRGRVRSITRRADEEGASSLHKLQAEAKATAAAKTANRDKRKQDEWDSKNVVQKAASAVHENIEKPVYRALKRTAKSVGPSLLSYAQRAGRWLGGDDNARRRLQSAQ